MSRAITQLRVPAAVLKGIKASAAKNGRSMNAEIQTAVEAFIAAEMQPAKSNWPTDLVFDYRAIGDRAIARGLTKREMFAAMAMQAIVGSPKLEDHEDTKSRIVTDAVQLADALLIELAKVQP